MGLDYFGARYFSEAQGRFTDQPLPDSAPQNITVAYLRTKHDLGCVGLGGLVTGGAGLASAAIIPKPFSAGGVSALLLLQPSSVVPRSEHLFVRQSVCPARPVSLGEGLVTSDGFSAGICHTSVPSQVAQRLPSAWEACRDPCVDGLDCHWRSGRDLVSDCVACASAEVATSARGQPPGLIQAFAADSVSQYIPAAVYDYYKEQVVFKEYSVAPDDDYEATLSNGWRSGFRVDGDQKSAGRGMLIGIPEMKF